MKRFLGTLMITSLVLGPVLVASAGDEPPVRSGDHLPTPLDPRVADVSPLGRSLRVESPGLEIPSGFSAVYRVPGDGGGMMRINGGLKAIFPQSVYQSTPYGSFPEIPAATIFQIGESYHRAAISSPSPEQLAGEEPVEYQGLTRAGYGYVPISTRNVSEARGSDRLPRFVRDADYRRSRLEQILRRRLDSPADVRMAPAVDR